MHCSVLLSIMNSSIGEGQFESFGRIAIKRFAGTAGVSPRNEREARKRIEQAASLKNCAPAARLRARRPRSQQIA